ncbi:hypothetical protein GWI33_001977 [Rhynchophorus ferrugineus]|uniref:Uncharacterized protein n=1 Tax=Rhynchophorus ferrugineus TaxID=354439 RepID=A0A834MHV4_RHYFE|nr:hypothetical protein GWI33_001977 [Rhynchophorus ferrugineus]
MYHVVVSSCSFDCHYNSEEGDLYWEITGITLDKSLHNQSSTPKSYNSISDTLRSKCDTSYKGSWTSHASSQSQGDPGKTNHFLNNQRTSWKRQREKTRNKLTGLRAYKALPPGFLSQSGKSGILFDGAGRVAHAKLTIEHRRQRQHQSEIKRAPGPLHGTL